MAQKFWLLIATILVNAILSIVFGILWIRAKSLQRFGTPSDPFAEDSYAIAERDRRNFQARGFAILVFLGALVLSLYGLWQFGLFDDLAGVSLTLAIQIVVAVVAASILLAAIVGQIVMSTGMRSSQDQMPVSWETGESETTEEAPLWLQSDDLDREQVRDSTPFVYRTAGHPGVAWRVAIPLVVLLGFFVCLYLGSKLPDELTRIEFLEIPGLKEIFVLLPLLIIVFGSFILLITRRRGRRQRGQRRPGVDYLWDKIVEEPPVPAEIPDWVQQLAPPEVGRGM